MLPSLAVDSAGWAPSYKRLNKANKTKNLRCFPRCQASGHNAKGFCGSAITLSLSAPLPAGLRVVGTLCQQSDHVPATLREGVDESGREVIAGVMAYGNTTATFGSGHGHGWNYPWASNRSTCKSVHVFRVFAVDASDAVVRSVDSPAFVVASSRGGLDRSAPPSSAASSVSPPVAKRVALLDGSAAAAAQSEPPSLSRLSSDAAFILKAMHERVVGPAGAGGVASAPPPMPPLPTSSETDAVLTRLFAHVQRRFSDEEQGSSFIRNIDANLDGFLRQNESVSLPELATSVRSRFSLNIVPMRAAAPMDDMAEPAARAVARFATLAKTFEVGGANDVSGTWQQAEVAGMDVHRVMLGFGFVERGLLSEFDHMTWRVQVFSPTEAFLARGPHALGRVFTCERAHAAANHLLPDVFPVASATTMF